MYGSIIGGTDDSGMYGSIIGGTDVTIAVCTQYHWWYRCHYSGMYGSIIGGTDDNGTVCTAASLVVQMSL